jgi:PKD repeat protein
VGQYIEARETATGLGGAGTPAASNLTAVAVTAATPPKPSLSVTPDSGVASLDVAAAVGGTYTETNEDGSLRTVTYTLNFGDGTAPVTGTLPASGLIDHTYTTDGVYAVTLTLADGVSTATISHPVVVALAGPLTADAGDDQVAQVAQQVSFDGSGSRPSEGITSYSWEFGDGSSATGEQVTHTYATAGTYTARLTVESGTQTA